MTWTDTDKAQWILENGQPHVDWIFERVGDTVYKRPGQFSANLPPWTNMEREQINIRGHND